MKLEDLLKRVDELIRLGEQALAAKKYNELAGHFVEAGRYSEFRAASLSFVMRTFGVDSPHYKEFESSVTDQSDYCVEHGLGVLNGCRGELAGGWVFSTKGLVSAELFSDFLEMAEHLLAENYKDPAAVVVGSVLEEH